ncbi:unnamed protein product [Arctogadus glacialis]
MGSWLRGIRVEIDPESLLPQHKHFVLQFRLAGTISTHQVQALLHLGGTMLLVAKQRDVELPPGNGLMATNGYVMECGPISIYTLIPKSITEHYQMT